MHRAVRMLAGILPFLYLAVFVGVALDYRSSLNSDLDRAIRGAAYEDIVGFGFWFNWIVLCLPFTGLCILSLKYGRRRDARYWAFIGALFVALTATGAFYGIRFDQKVWDIMMARGSDGAEQAPSKK